MRELLALCIVLTIVVGGIYLFLVAPYARYSGAEPRVWRLNDRFLFTE